MSTKKQKVIISFHQEPDFLSFLKKLPRQRTRRYQTLKKFNSLVLEKDDFETLKKHLVEITFHVENNIEYKLHIANPDSQVVPWGVEAIKAPNVWNISDGKSVRVGIIDTGIDGRHPDLRGNVRGGTNTVDNTSPLIDSNGHGTHVAGTIAALNNTIGVVGVAPVVQLYSLKAFKDDGTANLSDVAEAIHWAIDNNIQILNMSFGTEQSSVTLHHAIQVAHQHGIIMVASAGNSGGAIEYPAKHPEVISVGAVSQDRKIADFSSYGNDLNFVAPGVDILSTWPVPPYYNTLSGTSMAAPHITGICSLIKAKDPNLNVSQIKSILNASTVKLPRVSKTKQGNGAVLASKVFKTFSLKTEEKTN